MSEIKVKRRKLAEYKTDPHNANKGTERGHYMLQTSIEQTGVGRSAVADKHDTFVAGNGTAEMLAEMGIEDVIEVETDGKTLVVVKRPDFDLTDSDPNNAARRYAYLDNRAGEVRLDWDAEQLLADMQGGFNFDELFKQDELDALLAAVQSLEPVGDAEPQLDRAAELQAEWKTERGQVWVIPSKSTQGKAHRVMCGDSTSADDVGRLMDGEKAACMWSDPPYGVSYVGKTADALTIENDGSAGLESLLRGAFGVADSVLCDGAGIYIAHPPGALCVTFGNCFIAAGWHFHQTLIWVKNRMVLGHSDYHFKHEPLIYGWKGKNKHWYGERDKVSIFEIDNPLRNGEHPTMKPVELVVTHLQNSSRHGDIILDVFLGSGTTIVACEQTGRVGYGMEISPAYVAVILQRLKDIGLEPELGELGS